MLACKQYLNKAIINVLEITEFKTDVAVLKVSQTENSAPTALRREACGVSRGEARTGSAAVWGLDALGLW